jgi:hypothetical protein
MTARVEQTGGAGLRKVVRTVRAEGEYPLAQANRLASRFLLPTPIEAEDFPEKGNINQHTYLIRAGRPGAAREYLLQRINRQVFTRPRSVMRAMLACIQAQQEALAAGAGPRDAVWETITLLPTNEGSLYLEAPDRGGCECWRLMVKIPESVTYKSLGEISDPALRLQIAEEAGRGLALYGNLTADMDVSGLESPLPGYRDTRLYFDQLLSVLAGNRTLEQAASVLPADPLVRQSTQHHFLVHLPPQEYRRRLEDQDVKMCAALVRRQESFAMTLLSEMRSGRIRTVAIHGDTKLDNFLFCSRTGRAKALVDLDTIMPHTWLVDWGDMVRSLANVAGEKERDASKIQVSMDIYEALARGFLGSVRRASSAEIDHMADAVEIIALELGSRFLTDYLRGDTYFKLGPADPPDLNKVRALAQLTLFGRLREKGEEARRCISRLRRDADSTVVGEVTDA